MVEKSEEFLLNVKVKRLLIAFAILLVSGCRNESNNSYNTSNLLQVEIDFEHVVDFDEVKIFYVTLVEFDEDDLTSMFPTVDEVSIWSANEFSIFSNSNLIDSLTSIEALSLMSTERRAVNLNFNTYESIIEEKKNIFETLGINALELSLIYTLDLDEILSQQRRYFMQMFDTDFSDGIPEQEEDILSLMERLGISETLTENFINSLNRYRMLSWSEEDEVYLFSLRQLIDDIPLIMLDGNGLGDNIELVVSRKGIELMDVRGLVQLEEIEATVSILDSREAIQIIKDFYAKGLNLAEPIATSIELVYALNENALLVPLWVIEVSQRMNSFQEGEMRENIFHFINAVTGEFIK